MYKKLGGIVLVVLLGIFGVTACGQPSSSPRVSEEVSTGATIDLVYSSSEDLPGGCLSCHKKFNDDADLALSTIMDNLEKQGKHPPAPDQCLLCHQKEGVLPLGQKIHVTHYLESCVQCHKLNTQGEFTALLLEKGETVFISVKAGNTDFSPNGCADCHKQNSDGQDYSFPTLLKKLASHPPVQASSEAGTCMMCHKEGTMSLGKIMHKAHYKDQESVFVTDYGGSCRNCHLVKQGTINTKGLKN